MRPAIQPYTLRNLDEPLPETIVRLAETPLEGVELGLDAAADSAVREALEESGLAVPTIGAGFDDLETPEERLRPACEALSVDRVLLAYVGPEGFSSAGAARETAERVSTAVGRLDDHGLSLLYHNHDHEFTDVGGRTAFDVFVEAADPRLRFELDLGWIGTGGEDPAEVLAALGDRTPIVHVKDMHFESGEFADLGTGDLALEDCLAVASEAGVEWAIYEHDEPDDPLVALERGPRVLREALDAVADRA